MRWLVLGFVVLVACSIAALRGRRRRLLRELPAKILRLREEGERTGFQIADRSMTADLPWGKVTVRVAQYVDEDDDAPYARLDGTGELRAFAWIWIVANVEAVAGKLQLYERWTSVGFHPGAANELTVRALARWIARRYHLHVPTDDRSVVLSRIESVGSPLLALSPSRLYVSPPRATGAPACIELMLDLQKLDPARFDIENGLAVIRAFIQPSDTR